MTRSADLRAYLAVVGGNGSNGAAAVRTPPAAVAANGLVYVVERAEPLSAALNAGQEIATTVAEAVHAQFPGAAAILQRTGKKGK